MDKWTSKWTSSCVVSSLQIVTRGLMRMNCSHDELGAGAAERSRTEIAILQQLAASWFGCTNNTENRELYIDIHYGLSINT